MTTLENIILIQDAVTVDVGEICPPPKYTTSAIDDVVLEAVVVELPKLIFSALVVFDALAFTVALDSLTLVEDDVVLDVDVTTNDALA